MLTTSRNTVTVDSTYRNSSGKSGFTFGDTLTQELPAATNSYFAAPNQAVKQSEYSLEEITRKILGEGIELPPEYDEVDLSRVNGATPTLKTLSSGDEGVLSRASFYSDSGSALVRTQTLSSKQIKIALAAFAVIVLALAIVIALVGASVTSSFASVLALDAAGSEAALQVNALQQELALENEAEIIAKAQMLGYTLPNSSNTIEYRTPQLREAQNFNIESNLFDKICDFLSNLFGG